MSIFKTLLLLTCAITLSACAGTSYRPIVDSKGQDMQNYEQDLRECQQLASQISPAGSAAKSGLISALLGGAIGGIGWGGSSSVWTGAAIGAVTGGAGGGLSADQQQADVIKRCLIGRGYRILQ